eukprot:TRINITY_DN2163_c0_g1_i4.p1 TRINITY_DN2163_c0_g1~~TRINITY_DN2163_c0_g1_i4.p1  ORF type:complete len:419 (+),score=183.19 TRINITY_DN2163_c0_g1_i4:43-1257(+)
MGKKSKGKTKKNVADMEEDEDETSDLQSLGFGSAGDDSTDLEGPVEQFAELVDEHLSSKKSADRLAAMKQIKHLLISRPDLASLLSTFGLTLVMNTSRCVRNGKPAEAVLGLQLCGVAALYYAQDTVECVRDIAVLAIYMVKNSNSTVEEVCEAIKTMLMCQIADPFIDLDGDTIPGIFKELWGSKKKPEIVSEALSAWALCYVAPGTSRKPLYENAQKILNMVKATDSYDVCCAGLEVLGLVYEQSYDESGKPPPGLGRMEIDEFLQDCISDLDKTVSKTRRKDKKELARRVQSSVNESEAPSERMVFKGKTLDFEGWKKVLQLGALRTQLTTGLPMYVAVNTPTRKYLDMTHIVIEGKAMTRVEKKAMAKDSNDRSKERTMKDHKKSSDALKARYDTEDYEY